MIPQEEFAERLELVAGDLPSHRLKESPQRREIRNLPVDAVLQNSGMAAGARREILFRKQVLPTRDLHPRNEGQHQTNNCRPYGRPDLQAWPAVAADPVGGTRTGGHIGTICASKATDHDIGRKQTKPSALYKKASLDDC